MHLKEVCATPIYESLYLYCKEGRDTDRYSHLCKFHLLSHALSCKELQVVCHLDLGEQKSSIDETRRSQSSLEANLQTV